MKIQGFLDHLLKSSSGNGSVLNADFGKGAITGGALGLLLGKNKTSRKLATYGGLAAIGVMAYRAYNDYKQQQGGFAAGAGPQTVDRLPPPQAELHSQAILKALVAAAKADGHIDDAERANIMEKVKEVDLGSEAEAFLRNELANPVDIDDLVAAARTEEQKVELYTASRLAIDPDSRAERGYLDLLAGRLGLADGLVDHIEATVSSAQV